MSHKTPKTIAISTPRNIVLVGASVLNLALVRELIKSLHLSDVSMIILIHDAEDAAEQLLTEFSSSRLCFATDGAVLRSGLITLCGPGMHLLIHEGNLHLVAGPRTNSFRPSSDPLFQSAAAYHGEKVIAVLLSCKHCDGLAGAATVRKCGGQVLIPEPGPSCSLTLPGVEFIAGVADYVVPENELIRTLERMIESSSEINSNRLQNRDELIEEIKHFGSWGKNADDPKTLVQFSCPECGGPLGFNRHNGHSQFTCHIGHSYSSEALSLEQKRVVERALAIALRSMEDSSRLSRTLISMGQPENSLEKSLVQFAAQRADEDAEILRGLLRNHSAVCQDRIKICSD